jgi:hypothetical protein
MDGCVAGSRNRTIQSTTFEFTSPGPIFGLWRQSPNFLKKSLTTARLACGVQFFDRDPTLS